MTSREREALHLVGRGLTTTQIARRLGLSRRTVDQLLASATRKLGAASRLHAAAILAQHAADPSLIERIGASLRRLGRAATAIDPDGSDLLVLLGQGSSLGEAAAHLHLSRRTADRRLAAARLVLGVTTTAEALLAFQEVGVPR